MTRDTVGTHRRCCRELRSTDQSARRTPTGRLPRIDEQMLEPITQLQLSHATQFKIPTNPVHYSKEVILVGERKWNDIPACKSLKGDSLQAEISKLVMGLIRHYDLDERETDGAVHWNSMVPKLRKAFQKSGGRKFSDTDWLEHIYKGSNKRRFQCRMNSEKIPYCIFVPFKDNWCHSGTLWWELDGA